MAERAHPEDPGFQGPSPYKAGLFKRYALADRFAAGKVVLDIPCGVGWGTSLLTANRKIGIDISAEAIAWGKAHYPGIDFRVGDMASIPLEDGCVDTIVCLEGLEHVDQATGRRFLKEAVRVVRPDGRLVLTVPIIPAGGKHSGNRYHLYEPSLPELKDLLAEHFQTESMETTEGPDGPVVYFVGRPLKATTAKSRVAGPYPVATGPGPSGAGRRKANVLLTTSAAPGQSPFSTQEKRPPLGVGFLIAVLRAAGHQVFFIDNYLQPSDFLETDYLRANAIDVVGVYANTICFRDTRRMLHKLRSLRESQRWHGRVIVGGPHAAVAPHTIPDWVDHVVQGEGERALLDIVEGRVAERVVRYPRIENLDELPRPAWDDFVSLPYQWDTRFLEEQPVFTMNTSRGCPFQCTFCSVGSVWGKRYTCFSAERIVADIEHVARHYGARGIYFREDNFTLDQTRLRRFCALMIEKGRHVPWVCESRVSTLTRELVDLMVRAGLRGFYFGVESGSQRMLDLMEKGITVQQIENAFRWCHEFGVKAAASVVVGVPGETPADLAATRELIQRIRPTVVWPNVFVGIPDSRLCQQVLDGNAYEYIDDRGLVYLPGHNERAQRYYGTGWNAGIPNTTDTKDGTIRPKVSVLLAVHNGQRFVREALASIYSQTYQDFEVVVVDDGSTDGTPEILRRTKDSRTALYRNAENQGLTRSLNTGLALCRGEYVARMDADDVSHPERLARQVRFLDENPSCQAVGSWCRWLSADGEILGTWEPPTEHDEIRRKLLVNNSLAHGSVMARRSALAALGGYDERYRYAQDYDLWLRLVETGELRNLPEHLYDLRTWEGAASTMHSEEQKRYARQALEEACRRTGLSVAPSGGDAPSRAGPRARLSVVLTTYNRPELLVKVLEGFAQQTAASDEFEVIVVDDGSTPPVREVTGKFSDRIRLKYLRQENGGLAAARNAGIRTAEGDIVLFSDDDDVPAPELVAEHLRSQREYPDERIAVLGHLDWHPGLEVTPLMHYVTRVGGEYFGFDRLRDGQFYDPWKWWGGLVSAKRSLLQGLDGPFDARLRFGYEDTELACRLLPRRVKVLYNAKARSYVLKPVTFAEFCRRSYKQGRALHRVAAVHPETIIPRYQLENAVAQHRDRYAPGLEEWTEKVAKFEALLMAEKAVPGAVAERHLQALYAGYRECFRGYVLRGYVEQVEAARRGEVSLDDPVNVEEVERPRVDDGPAVARATAPSGSASSPARPLRIAFVDTNTPCYDIGSSSLRIHHIVKILVAQGHRIDYLYTNHFQSDKRYKAVYDGAVSFIKIQPSVSSFRDYLHFNGVDDLDVVWVTNLWALAFTDFARRLTQWLKANRPQTKVVIDTMDLHHKKHVRRFELSGDPQDREKAQRFLDLEKKLYPLADRVLAVTEVEKRDILNHAAARVAVVPNIHEVLADAPHVRHRRHICFLGAVRIRHNLDAIRWFLREVHPLIIEKAPEVQFHLLGHGNENFRETFEAYPNVKVVGYVENAERAVARYRVFVCPMTYGAGLKGKLGVAAGAGTPFVTTAIGAEGFDFGDGQHCFIADKPQEFADRCLRLLQDDDLWGRFQARARDLLEKRFSVGAVGHTINGLLTSLAVERCARPVRPDAVCAGAVASAPKVSIVMACRNGERYLRECLGSIRNQTLPEWELLVLDDGSTDGTRRIIEEYARADARIRPFYFESHEGPYVRRNFAIERAGSEFIVIQDADGLMSPHKLGVLYAEIVKDAQLAAVGSWYRDFLHEFKGLQYTDCRELPLEHGEIVAKLAAWRPALLHTSAIIRREMFRTIGPYDGNPFGSDGFWFAKLAEYARHRPEVRLRNVPAYLTLRRIHTGNQTTVPPTIDPRNRRTRYHQYCECRLRRIREKMRTVPGTDLAQELRHCDCSDFLGRFTAHIIRWESEPLPEQAIRELLEHCLWLFNHTFYVTCVGMLASIEAMEPSIARQCRNYDLLRALALFSLDMKEQSRRYLGREIENHDSPAAREFLTGCLAEDGPRDVQNWCLAQAGQCDLQYRRVPGRPAPCTGPRVPVHVSSVPGRGTYERGSSFDNRAVGAGFKPVRPATASYSR